MCFIELLLAPFKIISHVITNHVITSDEPDMDPIREDRVDHWYNDIN
jgi:hypothetical protein